MSDYWAANHGTGLVLNATEFRLFAETYIKKTEPNADTEDELEDLIEDLLDRIEYESLGLTRSKYLGTPNATENEHVFYITSVSTDYCDGTWMVPYFIEKDGELVKNIQRTFEGNKFIPNKDFVAHDLRYDDQYVVFSDKRLNSPDAFIEKPYPNYEALVQEFKDKLKAYLPDDFDWNAHIGMVDYASYA